MATLPQKRPPAKKRAKAKRASPAKRAPPAPRRPPVYLDSSLEMAFSLLGALKHHGVADKYGMPLVAAFQVAVRAHEFGWSQWGRPKEGVWVRGIRDRLGRFGRISAGPANAHSGQVAYWSVEDENGYASSLNEAMLAAEATVARHGWTPTDQRLVTLPPDPEEEPLPPLDTSLEVVRDMLAIIEPANLAADTVAELVDCLLLAVALTRAPWTSQGEAFGRGTRWTLRFVRNKKTDVWRRAVVTSWGSAFWEWGNLKRGAPWQWLFIDERKDETPQLANTLYQAMLAVEQEGALRGYRPTNHPFSGEPLGERDDPFEDEGSACSR